MTNEKRYIGTGYHDQITCFMDFSKYKHWFEEEIVKDGNISRNSKNLAKQIDHFINIFLVFIPRIINFQF